MFVSLLSQREGVCLNFPPVWDKHPVNVVPSSFQALCETRHREHERLISPTPNTPAVISQDGRSSGETALQWEPAQLSAQTDDLLTPLPAFIARLGLIYDARWRLNCWRIHPRLGFSLTRGSRAKRVGGVIHSYLYSDLRSTAIITLKQHGHENVFYLFLL